MSDDITPVAERRAPGLRLHSRTMHVQKADGEFEGYAIRFQEEHDLTDVEMLRILINCQWRTTKYMLRAERHPDDPERKADEE